MDIFDWIACAALVLSIGNTIFSCVARRAIEVLAGLLREITDILVKSDIV
jgi:hypothetical protein